MRRSFLKNMVALGAGFAVPRAFATSDNYPDRPIRVIVGFAPGGSVDPIIRIMQPKMSELLGQPIIIDNRPGASTSLACYAVKQAAPDGYTLLFTAGTGHAVHAIDRPEIPYDPIKDFTPVATVSRSGWAFVVSPALPVKNIAEYVAYCKANPDKVSFGSSGVGLLNHLVMVRFNIASGIRVVHVPYKATPNALIDLAENRIQAYFTSTTSVQALVKSGRIRALAYTATKEGDMPAGMTFSVAGYPEFDKVDSINALLGPANMPVPLVAKLDAVAEKVLGMPEIGAAMAQQEQFAFYQNGQQLTERLHLEHDKYLQVIRSAHIKMGGI